MSTGGNDRPAAAMIFNERIRQQEVEGYTPEHDDEHTGAQLALLAAAYALSSLSDSKKPPYYLSSAINYLNTVLNHLNLEPKPADPIRDLVRAGALILAELERRLRAEEKK